MYFCTSGETRCIRYKSPLSGDVNRNILLAEYSNDGKNKYAGNMVPESLLLLPLLNDTFSISLGPKKLAQL
jgi:hypothetical protein